MHIPDKSFGVPGSEEAAPQTLPGILGNEPGCRTEALATPSPDLFAPSRAPLIPKYLKTETHKVC